MRTELGHLGGITSKSTAGAGLALSDFSRTWIGQHVVEPLRLFAGHMTPVPPSVDRLSRNDYAQIAEMLKGSEGLFEHYDGGGFQSLESTRQGHLRSLTHTRPLQAREPFYRIEVQLPFDDRSGLLGEAGRTAQSVSMVFLVDRNKTRVSLSALHPLQGSRDPNPPCRVVDLYSDVLGQAGFDENLGRALLMAVAEPAILRALGKSPQMPGGGLGRSAELQFRT